MDIGSYKNIFFLRENMVKHNGFDSHSKNPQDVITHYKLKYDEIEESMKAIHNTPLESGNTYVSKKF